VTSPEHAPGVLTCPNCDTDLATTDTSGARPQQTASRACPDCDAETTVGLCWLPDQHYVVVGLSTDERECHGCHEQMSDVVVVRSREQVPHRRCPDCLGPHLAETLPDEPADAPDESTD